MINKAVYDFVPLGNELYKISPKTKTCKVAILVGKYNDHHGPCFLVRFRNGTTEWVSYLNGMEDDLHQEPGWYVIV